MMTHNLLGQLISTLFYHQIDKKKWKSTQNNLPHIKWFTSTQLGQQHPTESDSLTNGTFTVPNDTVARCLMLEYKVKSQLLDIVRRINASVADSVSSSLRFSCDTISISPYFGSFPSAHTRVNREFQLNLWPNYHFLVTPS